LSLVYPSKPADIPIISGLNLIIYLLKNLIDSRKISSPDPADMGKLKLDPLPEPFPILVMGLLTHGKPPSWYTEHNKTLSLE